MGSVAGGVVESESIPLLAQASVPIATSGKYAPEDIEVLAQWVEQTFGREEALAALRESLGPPWPDVYVNRETGRVYKPHNEKESSVVFNDTPRHALIKGGEGSGKSAAGIIKCLERIRRRLSGLMLSPDLPHFKRSLWLEFRRWCPWEQVDPKHRYRQSEVWEPYAPFRLVFRNGASLECGGIDEPGAWEGPNINFAFMDEMRRKKTAAALKVITGRIRISGPNDEPPQLWITTTPRRHWLYDFFGPLKVQCADCGSTEPIAIQEGEAFECKECGSTNLITTDEKEAFKRDSVVITLLTKDNEPNLEKDFAAKRALSLTEAEARVLLEAAWEDIEGGQPYLPHMTWWDDCREDLPVLDRETPLLLAVDAATGRTTSESDSFAIVGITRHPDPKRGKDTVAVRYIKAWQAKPGQKINFLGTRLNPGPEWELLRLCGWDIGSDGEYVRKGDGYNVKCIVTDPTELNDLMQRFNRKRIAWMYEFSQREKRIKADTDLLRIIQERRIAHDGDVTLRQHVRNADRGLTEDGKRMRIVKREDALKIDLLVATSMGTNRCLYLQL